MMRLVLFTTSDLRAGREADFIRMVRSVQLGAGSDLQVTIFALLQRCDAIGKASYEELLPPGSVVVAEQGRLSLSEARNRLFEIAKNRMALTDDCVVGFPDDDCWYPPNFVRQLVGSFSDDPRLDMLACRVSLTPVALTSGLALAPAKAYHVVRRSSSNSMFFRGALVAGLGAFDRTLGLGTPNGSGEDTDYALRAFLTARRAAFVDVPLVGHRESDLASVTRYFRGSVMVLGRYALRSPALFFEFTRKLGVGAYLALRSGLPVREYAASIVNSFAELQKTILDARRPERAL